MSIRHAACVAAALGLAMALAPGDALARGWHHGGRGGFGVFIGPPAPYYFAPRPYGFWGPPAYYPPAVVFAPPPLVYAPSAWSPAWSYAPAPTWIVPPAGYAPPRPQVRVAPDTYQQPLGGTQGGLKKKF
ncbi:hypothetical protein [Paracraurococcus lichenis]|uniref:Uncharacterized protein n=1 Tax=Paracraurococcus lichenis TaxID=3064888 RepID=A0ABT9DU57_9PROT|nr:hypothetical protein [Paracraurococcus sp. LOR1-02]MDO9707429.1 hypothetical protein [Paracraurococcus sp. LOR1-02]